MNLSMLLHSVYDFYHPNCYSLKEYLIKDGKKHKFALICPGGGYEMVCSFGEGLPYAEKLNEMGYSAFVLYYHKKSKAKCPAVLDDAARALEYIFSNAEEMNIDTDDYSVWGSSAGGHLAALFCCDKYITDKYNFKKPASVILSYPVVTMGELSHDSTRKRFLGKNPTSEDIKEGSVENNISKSYPPAFVWFGQADSVVNPENSKMFINELNRHGVDNQLLTYEGVDHGVGLGEGMVCEEWFGKAVEFWQMHMKKVTK